MDSAAPHRSPVRGTLEIAACIAGCLAIILSMCGQLFAARRLATDINSGHPSADQSFVHMLVVTPSLICSALAVLLCVFTSTAPRRNRGLAILGMALGIIAAALMFLDIPGSLATHHWVEPYPGGLR